MTKKAAAIAKMATHSVTSIGSKIASAPSSENPQVKYGTSSPEGVNSVVA